MPAFLCSLAYSLLFSTIWFCLLLYTAPLATVDLLVIAFAFQYTTHYLVKSDGNSSRHGHGHGHGHGMFISATYPESLAAHT
jgi:hypothetical protein